MFFMLCVCLSMFFNLCTSLSIFISVSNVVISCFSCYVFFFVIVCWNKTDVMQECLC